MKLFKIVYAACAFSSFLALVNTANAMLLKPPTFVMASYKTNTILSQYTESDYQTLFEREFPLTTFESILEIVKTIYEIRDCTYTPILGTNAKAIMCEISENLCLYLSAGIKKNKKVLLPQIKDQWQNLSDEQRDVLKVFVTNRLKRVAACGFVTAAIVAAFFATKEYTGLDVYAKQRLEEFAESILIPLLNNLTNFL